MGIQRTTQGLRTWLEEAVLSLGGGKNKNKNKLLLQSRFKIQMCLFYGIQALLEVPVCLFHFEFPTQTKRFMLGLHLFKMNVRSNQIMSLFSLTLFSFTFLLHIYSCCLCLFWMINVCKTSKTFTQVETEIKIKSQQTKRWNPTFLILQVVAEGKNSASDIFVIWLCCLLIHNLTSFHPLQVIYE